MASGLNRGWSIQVCPRVAARIVNVDFGCVARRCAKRNEATDERGCSVIERYELHAKSRSLQRTRRKRARLFVVDVHIGTSIVRASEASRKIGEVTGYAASHRGARYREIAPLPGIRRRIV